MQKYFRPWILIVLLCLIYVAVVIANDGGDPLTLVTIGTHFSEGIPVDQGGSEGYDGQFVYYIARDPQSAAQYIDVPAYRFQRILLPILARLLAFGQAALIPWSLLVIGLVSLAAGTALMETLLRQHGVSRWYALGYGLTLGVFGSVRLSVSEPLAYALALGGLLLALRERWLWAALLFALAALAKETTLLFPAACMLYLLVQRRWQIALPFMIAACAPFAAWQWVLYERLGAFGIGSGGAGATGFEIIPFAGIIRILTDAPAQARLAILLVFGALLLPFVIIPTLWGLRCCWDDWRGGKMTFYTWLLLVFAGVMLFVPVSTYREPLGILRFIVGLQIAVILYAASSHRSRALRNSTIWVVTTLLLLSPYVDSSSASDTTHAQHFASGPNNDVHVQ